MKASTYATYETGRNEPRFKDVFDLAKRVEAVSFVRAAWLIGQPLDYLATVLDIRHGRKMISRPSNRKDTRGPQGRAA